MLVQDVMSRHVSCCGPDTNAAQAAELMWNWNCGLLPVAAEDGRLLGIVTDRDLFIALGTQDRRASEFALGEIVNPEVGMCSPSDDLLVALRTMAHFQVRGVPVVDDDFVLQGMISIDDIVLHADATEKLCYEVCCALKSICAPHVVHAPERVVRMAA